MLVHAAEQGAFLLVPDAGRFQVSVDVSLGVVVGRDLVALAPLFVEAKPPPLAVLVVVLHLHAHGGAHAGEGVAHEAQQGSVPEAQDSVRLDGVEELAGLLGFQHRGFAALGHLLGARTQAAGFMGTTWPVTR